MVETEPSPTTLSNQPRGRERFNLRLALLVGAFTLAVFLTEAELLNHYIELSRDSVAMQVAVRGAEVVMGLLLTNISAMVAGGSSAKKS